MHLPTDGSSEVKNVQQNSGFHRFFPFFFNHLLLFSISPWSVNIDVTPKALTIQCNTVGGKKGEKRKKPVRKNEVQSSLNTNQLKASFFSFFLFYGNPWALGFQDHKVFKICITKPFTSTKWANKQTHFSHFNFLLLNRSQKIRQVLSNQHWKILHMNYWVWYIFSWPSPYISYLFFFFLIDVNTEKQILHWGWTVLCQDKN